VAPNSDGSWTKSRLNNSLENFLDAQKATKSFDATTDDSLARHTTSDQDNASARQHPHSTPLHASSMFNQLSIPKLTQAQRDFIVGARKTAIPSASNTNTATINSGNYMAGKVNPAYFGNNSQGLSTSSPYSNINAGVKHENPHVTAPARHVVSTPNMSLVQQYKQQYDDKFKKETTNAHTTVDMMADLHRRVAGKIR
jgi:hypothetical protein